MKETANAFKALAEQNRLEILTQLMRGEQCVCKLQEAIDLPQNLLSHHLSVLRTAGLVNSRKEGKWVYYSLNEEPIKDMKKFLVSALLSKKIKSKC
ncbi:MAG: metalloregulator ArsR/SmtB family transcription factor [Patescibacteria group bacterium]